MTGPGAAAARGQQGPGAHAPTRRWSPAALPRTRTQSWRRLTDGSLERLRPDYATRFTTAASSISTAELYWATPDMSALAMAAGASLPEVCFAHAYRPSASGLLVWDGGIGQSLDVGSMFDTRGRTVDTALGTVPERLSVRVPFDAVSWGPREGGMLLVGWVRWDRIEAALPGRVPLPGGVAMPPLMPMQGWDLPADPVAHTATEIAEMIDEPALLTVCLAMAAAWALMQQPKLAERSRVDAPKDDARRARRDGRPEPAVTLIDLRRLYRPQVPDEEGGEGSARRYRYRWVVSGHWRNQAFGPARSLRRQTWIPSYVKGPDGAPLLETERVNVWRR